MLGPELTSAPFEDRLAYGSVVEERTIMAVRGCDRLQYRKLLGAGPKGGWVSLLRNGTELLRLLPTHVKQLEEGKRMAWEHEMNKCTEIDKSI